MRKLFLLISLVGSILFSIHAETNSAEIKINFALGKSDIDSTFSHNEQELAKVPLLLSLLGDNGHLNDNEKVKIMFQGTTSPEGSHELNLALANQRLKTLEEYIRKRFDIPDSVITYDNTYLRWEWLKDAVRNSDIEDKESVLNIIAQPESFVAYQTNNTIDSRVIQLQQLNDGNVWDYLSANIFPQMRWASIYAVVERPDAVEVLPIPESMPQEKAEPTFEPEPVAEETVEEEIFIAEAPATDEWVRRCYLKTNALGWVLLQTNIAVEFDLASHWSFSLPAYYSAWDYFKSTIKFRTTDLKPQLRYWPSAKNQGWYIGAHFGLTWYNYAFDGKYRYQDYDRRSPAIGGGIGFGYRLPLSSNGRWHVEFGLSAGAYKLHYDKFLNEKNGRRVAEKRDTYIGLDNAAVTFSYSFGLKKKGGHN